MFNRKVERWAIYAKSLFGDIYSVPLEVDIDRKNHFVYKQGRCQVLTTSNHRELHSPYTDRPRLPFVGI